MLYIHSMNLKINLFLIFRQRKCLNPLLSDKAKQFLSSSKNENEPHHGIDEEPNSSDDNNYEDSEDLQSTNTSTQLEVKFENDKSKSGSTPEDGATKSSSKQSNDNTQCVNVSSKDSKSPNISLDNGWFSHLVFHPLFTWRLFIIINNKKHETLQMKT